MPTVYACLPVHRGQDRNLTESSDIPLLYRALPSIEMFNMQGPPIRDPEWAQMLRTFATVISTMAAQVKSSIRTHLRSSIAASCYEPNPNLPPFFDIQPSHSTLGHTFRRWRRPSSVQQAGDPRLRKKMQLPGRSPLAMQHNIMHHVRLNIQYNLGMIVCDMSPGAYVWQPPCIHSCCCPKLT